MHYNYHRSNEWIFVVRHCENGSCMIQVVDINQSYSPVAYFDYLRINITNTDIHRLTASIWDVSNYLQNNHFPINEIVCVSLPPYNMDWFEKYYPNFLLNWYDVPFFIQYMNGIKGLKYLEENVIWILDTVVTINKYNKITIYHAIYIKVFYDETVSYLTVVDGPFKL